MPRVGSASRLAYRTVSPAFPSQGPANLAATLAGSVLEVRRFGPNPVIRGRIPHELEDVPQAEMRLGPPYTWPTDLGPRPSTSAAARVAPAPAPATSSGGCQGCE